MKTFTTWLFILFGLLNLKAQDTVLITREDAIEKVREDNRTIRISEQDMLASQGEYRQTNAFVLPSINLSHTGYATTNPLAAFGAKLNQGILTPGDFDPDLLNNPAQIENYSTKIEVSQPLLNVDAVYQRKAAKSKLEAMRFQSERVEDHMVLEVEKAYMQLQLAYKTVEVLKTAEKAALENERIAINNLNQGYLQEADVLSVQVRVTEIQNQLQFAKSNIQNASNYLSVLMNTDSFPLLKPKDSLMANTESVDYVTFSEQRPDIQAMQLTSEAYKNQFKAEKMNFLPRLNAFGNYEWNDDEIFQGDRDGYLFGAQLSWNILDGTKRFGKTQQKRAQFEKSKIEYQQYLAQSQLEVNKANRMLLDAKNNLTLSELAMQQSRESYRIRKNRYDQGLEKTADLLFTETQYAQKQLEYYSAIYRHNYALIYLKFLTEI